MNRNIICVVIEIALIHHEAALVEKLRDRETVSVLVFSYQKPHDSAMQ